jgi:hypothetical protein
MLETHIILMSYVYNYSKLPIQTDINNSINFNMTWHSNTWASFLVTINIHLFQRYTTSIYCDYILEMVIILFIDWNSGWICEPLRQQIKMSSS